MQGSIAILNKSSKSLESVDRSKNSCILKDKGKVSQVLLQWTVKMKKTGVYSLIKSCINTKIEEAVQRVKSKKIIHTSSLNLYKLIGLGRPTQSKRRSEKTRPRSKTIKTNVKRTGLYYSKEPDKEEITQGALRGLYWQDVVCCVYCT
jgi:hypothetical protein